MLSREGIPIPANQDLLREQHVPNAIDACGARIAANLLLQLGHRHFDELAAANFQPEGDSA